MAALDTFRDVAIAACLLVTVLSCALGVLGMWRMRTPTQSLHYTGLPGTLGIVSLVLAVFLQAGNTPMAWKTCLIAIIFLAVNSAGAHAAARAFRSRQLGHWRPLQGDPALEKLRDTSPPDPADILSGASR